MPLPKQHTYTSEDYWNLPDSQRAELIDGQLYNMAPPQSDAPGNFIRPALENPLLHRGTRRLLQGLSRPICRQSGCRR